MRPNDIWARGSNGPTPDDATTTNPNCHHPNNKMANNEEVVGNKGNQEEGEDNEGRQQ
ncbi:hypothetical protein L208DRAFT_1414173 [Tricholoma matsutake]|nr:hypothetical protein L208DRAFT_1414173 [Tricholoma matsutake 945]